MSTLKLTLLRAPEGSDTLAETVHEIPDDGLSVSAALQHIARTTDPGLGFYLSCRRGVCACCTVRIDGSNAFACMVEVKDGMRIEPLRGDLIVKDTVADLSMARARQYRFPDEIDPETP